MRTAERSVSRLVPAMREKGVVIMTKKMFTAEDNTVALGGNRYDEKERLDSVFGPLHGDRTAFDRFVFFGTDDSVFVTRLGEEVEGVSVGVAMDKQPRTSRQLMQVLQNPGAVVERIDGFVAGDGGEVSGVRVNVVFTRVARVYVSLPDGSGYIIDDKMMKPLHHRAMVMVNFGCLGHGDSVLGGYSGPHSTRELVHRVELSGGREFRVSECTEHPGTALRVRGGRSASVKDAKRKEQLSIEALGRRFKVGALR